MSGPTTSACADDLPLFPAHQGDPDGKEHWGSVATRALAAFLRLVTERPLHAHVAQHNVGSRRVLEKCGFGLAMITR